MRGYIALSRVTAADNMLVARTFNPLLFRLGPQPFPSLLFKALHGHMDDMPEIAFIQLCKKTEAEYKAKPLLKDILWKCASCQKQLPWTDYFTGNKEKDWSVEFEDQICRPGALRECRKCKPRQDNGNQQTHACALCNKICPVTRIPEACGTCEQTVTGTLAAKSAANPNAFNVEMSPKN